MTSPNAIKKWINIQKSLNNATLKGFFSSSLLSIPNNVQSDKFFFVDRYVINDGKVVVFSDGNTRCAVIINFDSTKSIFLDENELCLLEKDLLNVNWEKI